MFLLLLATMVIPLPVAEEKEIPVGVYYYAWYGNLDGTPGTRHWDYTLDEPVVGRYSSFNDSVLGWQIGLIRDMGADLVFISWFGPGSFEEEAALRFLEVDRTMGWPLRFAVLVEPYEEPFNYTACYDHVWESFVEPYGEGYFRRGGRPILPFFNPARPPPDGRFEVHVAGDCGTGEPWEDWAWFVCEGGETSYGSSTFPPWFGSEAERVGRGGYCSVTPRFDDYHQYTGGARDSWRRFDVNLTDGLYERQWRLALEGAADGRVSLIGIYSWNEYHERSQIEPSIGPCGADPYDLYNRTRSYISRLREIEVEPRLVPAILGVFYIGGLWPRTATCLKMAPPDG